MTQEIQNKGVCNFSPHIYNMGCEIALSDPTKLQKRLIDGVETTRALIDKLVLSLYPVTMSENMVELFIKEVQDFLSKYFKLDYDAGLRVGSGYGYNFGIAYEVLDKRDTKIVLKYFDPSLTDKDDACYIAGSKLKNFWRQGVQVQITGNACQLLRHNGLMRVFMQDVVDCFPSFGVSQLDLTLDVFNSKESDLCPRYFFDLYRKGCYSGWAKLSVIGDALQPTVYIGKYKSNRSIMLYDKKLENSDTGKVDEPEIFAACYSWFRAEVHCTRDEKVAQNIFEYLLSVPEGDFYKAIAGSAKKIVESKCRFLEYKKQEGMTISRIPTDKVWQYLLNFFDSADMDFADDRKDLSLEERKENFKNRSIGGASLLQDILLYEGRQSLVDFVDECVFWEKNRGAFFKDASDF